MTFTHHAGDIYQAVIHKHVGVPKAQVVLFDASLELDQASYQAEFVEILWSRG